MRAECFASTVSSDRPSNRTIVRRDIVQLKGIARGAASLHKHWVC
jgi:hypothetical protein